MPTSNVSISFTAAGTIPIKVALHERLVSGMLNQHFIRPVHVQVIPTNKCNLHCAFCSCRDRDPYQELALHPLLGCLQDFRQLGCEAVTITGGGEPLLYKGLPELIGHCHNLGIGVGLVTNGSLLQDMDPSVLSLLRWCRISCADGRKTDFTQLGGVLALTPNVDWAFSYVLSGEPNYSRLEDHILFASSRGMTHVRVVPDLCQSGPHMDSMVHEAKIAMLARGVDISTVIFQDRAHTCRGGAYCRISLLKPVLAADGWIYPCCGVQYASDDAPHDMTPSMRMCPMGEVKDFWSCQQPFDGRRCDHCHYMGYNSLLESIPKIRHREFV